VPIFYPSVAVNMVIRFDEALLNGPTPDPKTATDGANSQLGGPGLPVAKAGLLDGASSRLTHVFAIVPKSASIELPTVRQTPKFTLKFAFKDFPIDPRAIRALGVEIYIGTVLDQDWADGMRGVIDSTTGGPRLSSQIHLRPENLMLAGYVDSLVTTHTDKGSEVEMEGKGLQGLFLAAKTNADQLKKLNPNQPVDQIVAQLLSMDAQGGNIPIRTQVDDWPNGIPNGIPPELITRINQGASGQATNLPPKGNPNELAIWDVITTICNVVGAVPYFIGHELWIRPARSIYDQKNAGLDGKTPFKDGLPRSIKTGKTSIDASFRKMVYGRNLNSFRLERKFGPTTVPVVKCTSVDTSSKEKGIKRLLEATFPDINNLSMQGKKAKTTVVDPSGNAARTEILTIPIQGISDKSRLRDIARQIREEIGRGEMGGSASSKDLASLGGDNDDADIIRLRPGDAVEFAIDAAGVSSLPPVVSELNSQAAMSTAEAVKALSDKFGGRQDLAEVLVGTVRGSFNGLQNVFRVNNVKYSWDIGSGIAVDFDFHNYIEARNNLNGDTTQGEIGDFTSSPVSGNISSVGAA